MSEKIKLKPFKIKYDKQAKMWVALTENFIRNLLKEAPMRKPKVNKEFVEKWATTLVSFIGYPAKEIKARTYSMVKTIIGMLKEAGVEVEE